MRLLDLQEYQQSDPYKLSASDIKILNGAQLSLTIEPATEKDGTYHITPSSVVGALEVGDLSVLIRPKIGIPQLLSMACYAMGVYRPQQTQFDHSEEDALPDVLALALASAARRAFSRGILHGYRTEEMALNTVRGRIRFDDQIRRRFGMLLPVELRYDEFTNDILENRLVKAAVMRLNYLRPRSQGARSGLGWVSAMLEDVSLIEYSTQDVPRVSFNQLNEHYRQLVSLSRLILMHSLFEAQRGGVRANGFLMNMNQVFQEFVTVALREALGLSERVFCSDNQLKADRRIWLDEDDREKLLPDLTWWSGTDCLFVADVKYKRIINESVPNADLYQMLAYATALDLPGGMLIYAKGEADTASYVVKHARKRIEVVSLDLSGSLEDVLDRVGCLADWIREFSDLHSSPIEQAA